MPLETKKDSLPRVINSCAQAITECADAKDIVGLSNILFKLHLLAFSLYSTIEAHSKNKQKVICDEKMKSVRIDFSKIKDNVEFSQLEPVDDEETTAAANIHVLRNIMVFCLNNTFKSDGVERVREKLGANQSEEFVDYAHRLGALFNLIILDNDSNSQARFECVNFFLSKWIFEISIDAGIFKESEAPIRSQSILAVQREFNLFREYRMQAKRSFEDSKEKRDTQGREILKKFAK